MHNLIKHGDTCYKRHTFFPNSALLHSEYKNRQTILKAAISNAKKEYYHNRLTIALGNPRKIWSVLNLLVHNKISKQQNTVNKLQVEDDSIEVPKKIADILNTHFTEIGKALTENIPEFTYTKPTVINCQQLYQWELTTPQEINKVISELKSRKA